MSALAQVLRARGHRVSGSDRSLDKGLNAATFQKLSQLGISCHPQNGSGLENGVDIAVVSSAIEESNPDIKTARERGIPIVNRAALLAVLFNDLRGVAVAGTNGKTTVTGMVGWILDTTGIDPTVTAGGIMKNYVEAPGLGNVRLGHSDVCVIEADESDGSLIYYRPKVGVITNITKDHKPIDELLKLFSTYVASCSKLAVNSDCPLVGRIKPLPVETVTFGFNRGALITATGIDTDSRELCSSFKVSGVPFELNLPGRHNVMNALAAISTAHLLDIPLEVSAEALRDFRGIKRRLDVIGETRGIKVIDDFAHNPVKIRTSIESVRPISRRILAIYQPHGYRPTRFLREELVQTFSESLCADDALYMPEIFYAGGTAKKDISSKEIIDSISANGIRAHFVPARWEIAGHILSEAVPGDVVLVMGARDDTLTDFCLDILNSLKEENTRTGVVSR